MTTTADVVSRNAEHATLVKLRTTGQHHRAAYTALGTHTVPEQHGTVNPGTAPARSV
jgi:hypothetical protein